jgi:hypothetical protein
MVLIQKLADEGVDAAAASNSFRCVKFVVPVQFDSG